MRCSRSVNFCWAVQEVDKSAQHGCRFFFNGRIYRMNVVCGKPSEIGTALLKWKKWIHIGLLDEGFSIASWFQTSMFKIDCFKFWYVRFLYGSRSLLEFSNNFSQLSAKVNRSVDLIFPDLTTYTQTVLRRKVTDRFPYFCPGWFIELLFKFF